MFLACFEFTTELGTYHKIPNISPGRREGGGVLNKVLYVEVRPLSYTYRVGFTKLFICEKPENTYMIQPFGASVRDILKVPFNT